MQFIQPEIEYYVIHLSMVADIQISVYPNTNSFKVPNNFKIVTLCISFC